MPPSVSVKVVNDFDKLISAAERAAFKNLGHAANRIRKDAIASIQPGDGPSAPGTPPNTHTQKITKRGKVRAGALPRSIIYDASKKDALIGPRKSVVGLAGKAMELGGKLFGQDYPERPFMGPAMVKSADRFAADWQGSIGE